MAGITPEGLVIKRLTEVLTEKRNLAVRLFQDLASPGDVVDTSDSSALGRLVSLASPSEADLWEALQQVYSAFDPNSATGIALDNIVAIGGITREGDSYSTAPVTFRGTDNTLIPVNSVVQDSVTNNQWETRQAFAITTAAAMGIKIQVGIVADSATYSVSYTVAGNTSTISYTSGVSATAASILAGIKAVVDSVHPTFTATILATTLTLDRVDPYQTTAFTITSNLTITEIGVIGEVEASEVGAVSAEAGNINTILTPVLGWNSVTNPLSASEGVLAEIDEQLRERFRTSKFIRATNSLDAIYSAISSVSAVEEVRIYENDTDVVDSNGVPPKSFLPIVVGGLTSSIANAIWENKPIGILSHGNTTATVYDIQGFPQQVKFSRPTPVNVYISLTIATDTSFPGDGADQIKQALISYAESNFGVGDDVIFSRLYTPINSIAGHQVDSLTIGTSPSPVGVGNVAIAFDQIANLLSDNIIVTIS